VLRADNTQVCTRLARNVAFWGSCHVLPLLTTQSPAVTLLLVSETHQLHDHAGVAAAGQGVDGSLPASAACVPTIRTPLLDYRSRQVSWHQPSPASGHKSSSWWAALLVSTPRTSSNCKQQHAVPPCTHSTTHYHWTLWNFQEQQPPPKCGACCRQRVSSSTGAGGCVLAEDHVYGPDLPVWDHQPHAVSYGGHWELCLRPLEAACV
jgi:hypothetical protein